MTTKLNIVKHVEKYTDAYFSNDKHDKILKHDIEKMIINLPYYNEGLACLSEENVSDKLNNKLSILTKQLIRSILIIVDVGLHYNNTKLTFDVDGAIQYIKKFNDIINLSDDEIYAYILKILASPASMCTHELARYTMHNYKLQLEQLGYNFYDVIYSTPFDMTSIANLIQDLQKEKEKKN